MKRPLSFCGSRNSMSQRKRRVKPTLMFFAPLAVATICLTFTFEQQQCNAFQSPASTTSRPFTSAESVHLIHRRQENKNSWFAIRNRKAQHSLSMMAFPEQLPEIIRHVSGSIEHIGGAITDIVGSSNIISATKDVPIPEAETSVVLESIGKDLLVFLTASVFVTPIAAEIGVTPILGYLLAGAVLGPHGIDVFSNTKADLELGDFGILFLLFSEGLEVTSARLRKLADFLPLGLAQISLSAGILSLAILNFPEIFESFLPLDAGLINIQNPAEALVLALAGTLSTSAFIFPVLKERGWEEEESGQAATSILLLQDLAVAPLLVLLPYAVGQDSTDPNAIAVLTAKATLGFGSVVAAGSFILRRLFRFVAQTRSTETFVALCLLVSVGMGTIAKTLGLTDTVGAFAAGVLLANTNYRAQIQADILPFKGILLGIFFMTAGSSFDPSLVICEWPTIITGVLSLIVLKAATLFAATRVPRWMEPNRLPTADGVRLALLLSGGGEFAFVVLALAEKLDVLPGDLGGLLTAIVLITMAITPLLSEVAAIASKPFDMADNDINAVLKEKGQELLRSDEVTSVPAAEIEENLNPNENAVIVCGYGDNGKALLNVLEKEHRTVIAATFEDDNGKKEGQQSPSVVAFSINPLLAEKMELEQNEQNNGINENTKLASPTEQAMLSFGDGCNPEVLRNSGVTNPAAIFVSYKEHDRVLLATSRLRAAFEDVAIYARAGNRNEAQSLQAAGATEVIVEEDDLSRSAVALMNRDVPMRTYDNSDSNDTMKKPEKTNGEDDSTLSKAILSSPSPSPPLPKETSAMRLAVSKAVGIPPKDVDHLLEIYQCMDRESSGLLDAVEFATMLRKLNAGILSDHEIEEMEDWIVRATSTTANDILSTVASDDGDDSDGFLTSKKIDIVQFGRLYKQAPPVVKDSMDDICLF